MADFFALTPSQQSFVDRVCASLRANLDPAAISVYGDGTASPNGEKFAATRLGHSWDAVFDFGTGECFHTHVQLPVDWIAMWQAKRRAA